jgi:hypothetical protein
LKKLPLRAVLAIAAAISFAALCVIGARQTHVIDFPDWSNPAEHTLGWGEEPTDIGPPADILLLALNLPALIALLPLLPLTEWIQSETVLRTAWGIASVGQWFLIGRYLDIRRGLVAEGHWKIRLLIKRILFFAAMVGGALALIEGLYSGVSGHSSGWAFVADVGMVFWGMTFLIFALRWRASFGSSIDRIDSLGLS